VSEGKKPQEGRRSRKRRANPGGSNTLKWHCGLGFYMQLVCIFKSGVRGKSHEGRHGVKLCSFHRGGKPWRGKGSRELRALVGLNHQLTVTDSRVEQNPEVGFCFASRAKQRTGAVKKPSGFFNCCQLCGSCGVAGSANDKRGMAPETANGCARGRKL